MRLLWHRWLSTGSIFAGLTLCLLLRFFFFAALCFVMTVLGHLFINAKLRQRIGFIAFIEGGKVGIHTIANLSGFGGGIGGLPVQSTADLLHLQAALSHAPCDGYADVAHGRLPKTALPPIEKDRSDRKRT